MMMGNSVTTRSGIYCCNWGLDIYIQGEDVVYVYLVRHSIQFNNVLNFISNANYITMIGTTWTPRVVMRPYVLNIGLVFA